MSQQPKTNTDEGDLYCLWRQGIPQKVLLKFDNHLDLLDEEIMKEINISQWLFENRAKKCPILLIVASLDLNFPAYF